MVLDYSYTYVAPAAKAFDTKRAICWTNSRSITARSRPAAEAVGLKCNQCLFIDDSFTNVEGAEKAGMIAHHYEDVEGLRQFLDTHLKGQSPC